MISADDQEPPMDLDDEGREARDGYIREVIDRYRSREEWEILDDVRTMVQTIESRLGPVTTL